MAINSYIWATIITRDLIYQTTEFRLEVRVKKELRKKIISITLSTETFKDEIWHGPANIPADRPDPTGCGGNTTTGNVCKRFFGPKKRRHIVKLYKFDTQSEEDDFSRILQGINCILRILSSWRKKVDIEKFESLVKETHAKLHLMFP